MSVIQDALRRKLVDQQREKSTRPARPTVGAVPPPTPPIAQRVLQQESIIRPEIQYTHTIGPDIGTHPPYPSWRGGVGRWMMGIPFVLLCFILVGGVFFYRHHDTPPPPAGAPGAVPQPLLQDQPAREDTDLWPKVTVNGVLASPNTQKSSAILNGEMVFLNQKIRGVRLMEVSNEGVQLQYRGKTMALRIGDSTFDDED